MNENRTIFSVYFDEGSKISRWFWADELWLPKNITWEEYFSLPSRYNVTDLTWYSLIAAVGFIIVRLLLERFVFVPLAASFGIHKPRVRKLTPNPILEDACKKNSLKTLKKLEIQVLAKELNWTERQVERWFRDRSKQNKISPQQKFCESAWRFIAYTSMVIFGCVVLRNKPYFADLSVSYAEPRNKSVESDVDLYGFLAGGLYFSFLVTTFSDIKRKDFTMMLVHHLATLIAEYTMWFSDVGETGIMINFCHDVADIFLEAAKLFVYMKNDLMSGVLLVVFFFVWCVTRLYLYPVRIIQPLMRDSAANVGPLPYYILSSIFLLLLAMHIMWTWLIIKTVQKSLNKKSTSDARSDDSEEDLSSEDENRNKIS